MFIPTSIQHSGWRYIFKNIVSSGLTRVILYSANVENINFKYLGQKMLINKEYM